jgi:hypothetical protein
MNVFIIRAFKTDYSSVEMLFEMCQKMAGNTTLYKKTGNAKELLNQCTFNEQDDPAIIKEFTR